MATDVVDLSHERILKKVEDDPRAVDITPEEIMILAKSDLEEINPDKAIIIFTKSGEDMTEHTYHVAGYNKLEALGVLRRISDYVSED